MQSIEDALSSINRERLSPEDNALFMRVYRLWQDVDNRLLGIYRDTILSEGRGRRKKTRKTKKALRKTRRRA